jgi:hypothetical protein
MFRLKRAWLAREVFVDHFDCNWDQSYQVFLRMSTINVPVLCEPPLMAGIGPQAARPAPMVGAAPELTSPGNSLTLNISMTPPFPLTHPCHPPL